MEKTSLEELYAIFLQKVTSDEWLVESEADLYKEEWRAFLDSARPLFLFPRTDIAIVEESIDDGMGNITSASFFNSKLNNIELQILATLMKAQWMKRLIADVNVIRQGYNERDWSRGSQANHLDKMLKLSATIDRDADMLQRAYDRSRDSKPFPFSRMVGKQ